MGMWSRASCREVRRARNARAPQVVFVGDHRVKKQLQLVSVVTGHRYATPGAIPNGAPRQNSDSSGNREAVWISKLTDFCRKDAAHREPVRCRPPLVRSRQL